MATISSTITLIDKMSPVFGTIGKVANATLKTISVGIAASGVAIAGVATKALSAMGELEQQLGGMEAVFTDTALSLQQNEKQLEALRKTADNAFMSTGLSTNDYCSILK